MHSNLKLMHTHYGGIVGTFKAFEALHRTLTENYSCMIIQLSRLKSSEVEKSISFLKATAPLPYRLGNADQWAFNRKNSIKENRSQARNYKRIKI
jgi:hypothetical protein